MFKWDSRFEIKNGVIDEEHSQLFSLLNKLAEDIDEGDKSESELKAAVDYLIEYAEKHFRDEEGIMFEKQVDARHVRLQKMEHASFMQDVKRIANMSGDISVSDKYERLVSFVTSWLVFHTLSTDQFLGVQLREIAKGTTPEDAYIKASKTRLPPLFYRHVIKALVHLWTDAADRVHELENQLGISQKEQDSFDEFYRKEAFWDQNPAEHEGPETELS